ncbi:hypothetical protein LWI28_021554 [Acer negundo]|uniref:EF-hand domain-containing protein n=1 Tax=Acer negundo TaxID=4023 RepID=A0AAD5IGH8_ACENE|nr:hypothetical protein LWI28_021554 [Acer negundo]
MVRLTYSFLSWNFKNYCWSSFTFIHLMHFVAGSLSQRFCQLNRNGGGFISADEFLSVPEFAVMILFHSINYLGDNSNDGSCNKHN